MTTAHNTDPAELGKFESLGGDWWSPDGALKTLHIINPVRLAYVAGRARLEGSTVIDVGCGGGILSEALAQAGARVTGIDASGAAIDAAVDHARGNNLDIRYFTATAEAFAADRGERFDVLTCMELLEHLPDPESLVRACATLTKPGGHLFLSTINRSAFAWAGAVLGAEYLLGLLPRGTHQYARFLRPSELARMLRGAGFTVHDVSGMTYIPWLDRCLITRRPSINYLIHARRAE